MITLTNVNKYYKSHLEHFHALKNVDLHISDGEMVAIMGPSGSGKSTLINILGFLDTSFDGEYIFEESNFINFSDVALSKIRNTVVGFVFQNFSLIENNTVFENVELPLLYNDYGIHKTKELVQNALIRVGLDNKAQKYPKHLSGGQQQRVAIARALVNKPRFLMADEPTGALDTHTSKEILKLIQNLNRLDNITCILVTHDPDVVSYCSRLIKIEDGKITSDKEIKP
ncbi:ABC transporter ATP-binding protein [Enterococcus sp. BWB1-3]|uniref:ABC transporter ATP-binding protein n=1 Tax=Enterococcus sp. BWB1-3 TaxID=2787713 RepID=UPI0019243249|nr:ABC transporter ATP-binding protein [Enterococcus sp. BWB1-3]MBL1229293.1 ABC transporter ATP-binding protein [Enterococcus sp. BWB1-3]